GHLQHLQVHPGRLAGQRLHAPVARELDLDVLFLAGGHAGQGRVDGRQHRGRTDHAGAAVGALGGQALLASLGPALDLDGVAGLGGAIDHGPAAALLAQVDDHAVDVFLGDLGRIAHDLQAGHVDLAELGHQFEGGDIGKFGLVLAVGRLDPGVAGNAQLIGLHGLVEALAQQAVQDLGADLLAEALPDHAGRDLAGTETLDPGGPRDLAQAATHLVVHVPGRNLEGDAALEIADGLDRNLRC